MKLPVPQIDVIPINSVNRRSYISQSAETKREALDQFKRLTSEPGDHTRGHVLFVHHGEVVVPADYTGIDSPTQLSARDPDIDDFSSLPYCPTISDLSWAGQSVGLGSKRPKKHEDNVLRRSSPDNHRVGETSELYSRYATASRLLTCQPYSGVNVITGSSTRRTDDNDPLLADNQRTVQLTTGITVRLVVSPTSSSLNLLIYVPIANYVRVHGLARHLESRIGEAMKKSVKITVEPEPLPDSDETRDPT